jgi:hypothetical protein
MGAKIQAFEIFHIPLSSHYPLPLKKKIKVKVTAMNTMHDCEFNYHLEHESQDGHGGHNPDER